MQRNVLIVIGVLVALIGVTQITAMQQQTTIPGLLFPSATPTSTLTPTHTLTPTNTLTPTITLTATKTLTPTPDVYAICSAVFNEFYSIRNEQLNVYNDILIGMSEPYSRSVYEKLDEKMQIWIDAYTNRLPKNIDMCSQYIRSIAVNDIMANSYFRASLVSMKEQDFDSAQMFINQAQIVASETNTYELLMANEISEYRQRAPQYSWPNVP